MTVEVTQEKLEKRAISRSAFMVMLGGGFSILAGFANQVIIAAFFGAGAEMDAYLTALVIPNYLHLVLLSGLSFVFIPAFVHEETNGNEEAAWELVGTFFWILTGILIAISFIGSLLAKEIIFLIAPGFSPEKSMLAVRMLSVLMFSVPFAGLSSFTRSVQNARNSFFWPAFGGAANSIGNLLAVLLLTQSIGSMALAWGILVANIFQSCITVLPVLRHGWSRLIPLTDYRILETGRLLLPFIICGLLTSGTTVFERYFASGLPTGQISYLGYAGKISNIYQQLLVMGIALAIFPVMAKIYTQKGEEGLKEKTVYGLRLTLAVALPAVLITGALSFLIVKILFERGEFHSTDTFYVHRLVLIVMLNGVLCGMLSNILIRAFYVLKDTLTPPVIGAFSAVIYVCIGKFFASQWGYTGLAYASLIENAFFVLILYVFLIYKLPGIALKQALRGALTYCLAATGAYFTGKFLSSYLVFLPDLINLSISALVSGVFYLAILYFRDREILSSILEMLGIQRLMDFFVGAKSYLNHNRTA